MTAAGGEEEGETELFLVDSGIESLNNVYLNLPKLRSLNVHSNYISK